MKWKLLSRVIPPLLCASLCACAAAPSASAVPAVSAASLSAYVEAASYITLELEAPTDWSRDSAEVAVTVTDSSGSGFASAEVKVGRDGSWRDISRYSGVVEVSDNGPVAVKVTGHDGTVYEQSCDVACLDRTAPTVRAVVDGGKLCIEARDNRSGIASILVDGKEYAAADQKTMSVTVENLDTAKEQVTVQAVDKAGNRSAAASVDNPNYQPPKEDTEPEPDTPDPTPTPAPEVTTPPAATTTTPSDTPQQSSGGSQTVSRPDTSTAESGSPSASTGTSASASADPESGPDTTPRGDNALTPDGQGTVVDNADEEAGKEFFTITTADKHDAMIAFTSQLAHVVSNAYVKSPAAQEHKGYSAGSYKDLTRVAWLNEEMWAELFLENREHLLTELNGLMAHLDEYRAALEDRDQPRLKELLRDGRLAKERVDQGCTD